MPLPKPGTSEPHDAFLARCMGDEVMNSEYAERDERFAVCNSLWEKKTMGAFHKSYGDAIGPLGLPMKSDVARDLEATLKGLDGDCKSYLAAQPEGIGRKARAAEIEFVKNVMADISVITTGGVDLDNEVVAQDGLDFAPFEKNGKPVTMAHNYQLPTVARAQWVVRQPNCHKAKTEFHARPGEDVLPKEAPWFPSVAFHYVKELGMRGRSIGFVPTAIRVPTKADIEARPELGKAKLIIAKAKVFEYAITGTPCNQEAMVEMVCKAAKAGIIPPREMLDALGIVAGDFGGVEAAADGLRPPADETKVMTRAEVREAIRKGIEGINLAELIGDARDRLRGKI